MKPKRNIVFRLLFILIFMFIGITESCYVKRNVMADKILLFPKKDIILLHMENKSYRINNPMISENHLNGLALKFNKSDDFAQDRRIDIFVTSRDSVITDANSNKISIPLENIEHVEVYDLDVGKTVLISAATITVIAIVVAVLVNDSDTKKEEPKRTNTNTTTTSCPFVYVQNGEKYEFVGEVYAGATAHFLERNDYLKIPAYKSDNRQYNIKFDNTLEEIQNTNLMELIVINHDANDQIEIDKYGKYHTITNPIKPIKAENKVGSSILKQIEYIDNLSYMGSDKKDKNIQEEIYLNFKNQNHNKRAKLIVNAKNTIWLDHIYSEFMKLSGKKHEIFKEKLNKLPKSDLIEWQREQGISLSLYIKEKNNWKYVDDYTMVGPLQSKQQVLEFDVSSVNNEIIELKLVAGKYFWDIDYAAMDFSPDKPVNIQKCKIESCKTNQLKDIKEYILKDDDQYACQQNIGDQLNVSFQLPEFSESTKQSFILHTKGFYDIKVNAIGKPQRSLLKKFKKPGYFMKYSDDLLQEQIALLSN